MGRNEPNNSIFEDVDSSEQTIRLVKDVEDENTKETKEVDVLADFKSESTKREEPKTTKKEKVIKVEDDDNIPFEPTRELKVPRVNSYNDSDEYKERVIVNHSDDQVGVKKIIIGEETTTLPIYKRPKKSSREILRDITLYIMMVAIVSTIVILLMKSCKNKNNKDTLLDAAKYPTTQITTRTTSITPNTETTSTTSTISANTETTSKLTTEKHGLVIPTQPKPTTPKTTPPATQKPTPTEEPVTTAPTEKPTETTKPTEDPTKPTEDPTTPVEETNPTEQG